MDFFDPVLLARIQFAFTVSFHIIFPAFTIGLASFLAVIEWRWLATKNPLYQDLYKFWIKIFAVAFGMGVVSGLVMSYQFGTNWSVFSDRVANVLGPLLGYEVLTAFFLEASFLGVMLFGWGRVSPRMHFVSTCIVAGGTLVSAFWILSANSWMQTPQGFEMAGDGRVMPLDWIAIIFNPSFAYRYVHMVIAAFLSTAFVVGGVGAYYLHQSRHMPQARIMLGMATLMALIVAPTQMLVGHAHGENTMEHQPIKVAAMEGNWDKTDHVPLYLFGMPDEEEEETKYGVTIPEGASWILTGDRAGRVPHLKSVPKEDRPPVAVVFWSFRVMVGIGVLMIGLGILSAFAYWRGRLFDTRILRRLWMLMIPSGFVALLAGWFVTEVGRQPWTAYGLVRTAESVSPAILGPQVAWSLLAFVVMYSGVFGAGMYYMVKLVRKGLSDLQDPEGFYRHGIESVAFNDPAGHTQKTVH
ncbi:MAG: cytochrome ubiquinol oxidase subunit I [Candidatus Puniceispirillum sp.]|nr:cytochrome ubiquinol oxidase subunit I [Candidatus Puniceispirillum sp.]